MTPYNEDLAKKCVVTGEQPITEKEMRVLEWVMLGLCNKTVADKLNVSPLTIKNYIRKIGQKMGVGFSCNTRFKCVYRAIQMGLIVIPVDKSLFIPPLDSVPDSSLHVEVDDWVRFRNVLISPSWRKLVVDTKPIRTLTPVQFDILVLLMRKPNKVFTRQAIIDDVYGTSEVLEQRQIDVHVSRLRAALAGVDADAAIQTVRNYGYRLVSKEEAAEHMQVYDGL